jgi:uncharacterized protein involved in response to NO
MQLDTVRLTAAGGASGSEPWRLVTSEAHRTMFFCGALQAVVAMSWWMFDLGARYAGWYAAPTWTVPPMWAHAWLIAYGLFPFFIFGFLMTAGPNWLGAPKTPRLAFLPAAALMASGLVTFYIGLITTGGIAAAGATLHALGWLWAVGSLVRMAVRYRKPGAAHVLVIFTFVSIGLAGDAVFAMSVASTSYSYVPLVLHAAIWFFLLPVFIGVSTRMVPFFSSRVLGAHVNYTPAWARPVLMGGVLIHGALELARLHSLLWIPDLPLGGVVIYLAWRWGLARSWRVKLLAVLHISLVVLASSFLLSGALSVAVAAGLRTHVGLAPLHLLVIGYFAAMTLGMVSRVSLGHSGRPLEADALTWRCYLGVLLAAGLRVCAEFLHGGVGSAHMLAAAAARLIAFGFWAYRYAPIYLKPRADAR